MKSANDILSENKAWVDETFAKIDAKLRKIAVRSKDKIVDGINPDGSHKEIPASGWTSGFFGGMNVLMYEHTKESVYLECAKAQEKLLDSVLFHDIQAVHHDVGFMWHILSGALYRLTGDEESKNRELTAAFALASRVNIDGKFINAWNGAGVKNLTIVDTMMNLPLLFSASEILDNDRFARLAKMHADLAMRDHIRDDGSVCHKRDHDRDTGRALSLDEVIAVGTEGNGVLAIRNGGQGYSYESSWTRGQGWALYGFTLMYIHTKEKKYLDAALRVANYVISNMSGDWLPRIDFRAPDEPVLYDSTAGCIFACALIELSRILPEAEGGVYMNAAVNMLRAMTDKFTNFDENTDYIMGYGSVYYPPSLDRTDIYHIPIIYGDYYYAEAILKLRGQTFLAW